MRYHVPSGGAGGASATAVSAGSALRRRPGEAGLAGVAAFGVFVALFRELERVVRVVVEDLGEAALSPVCAANVSDWVGSDCVRLVLLGINLAVGGRADLHADGVRADTAHFSDVV